MTRALDATPAASAWRSSSPSAAVARDLREQEHLVVHREAEQHREHHQRHVAGDRHGVARRVDAEDVDAPAVLEDRRQHAEGRPDAAQVDQRGLERHEQRAERDQQHDEAQREHDDDDEGQPRGDLGGEVDVGRGGAADVGPDVLAAGRRREHGRAHGAHEVGRLGGRGSRRGDGREDRRVALRVDLGRRREDDPGGRDQGVLDLHQPGVGAAVVAAGLGQLLGELVLQRQRLLLLRLRGVLEGHQLRPAGPGGRPPASGGRRPGP